MEHLDKEVDNLTKRLIIQIQAEHDLEKQNTYLQQHNNSLREKSRALQERLHTLRMQTTYPISCGRYISGALQPAALG